MIKTTLVICGVYFLTRVLAYLIFSTGQVDEFNRYKRNRVIYRDKLTNRDLEKEIKSYIFDVNNEDEIMQLLEKDLRFVFGKDFKKEFVLPYFSKRTVEGGANFLRPSYWAKCLLLSKKGYIPRYEYDYGFIVSNVSSYSTEWNKRMLMAIEKNLQEQGIDTKFYKFQDRYWLDVSVYSNGRATREW